MLNQRFPSPSRVMPCVFAASPPAFGTLKNLTAPVLASMRPIVTCRFGTLQVNHRLPSRSDQASCTSSPIFDGVPSDQSWPSLLRTGELSASGGTSYARNTTRAVSPLGRDGSVIFIELSP